MKLTRIKILAACVAVAACVAASASAKTVVRLKDCDTSGFNALDHVLQKPLGNPSFPSGQNFGNNMFLSLGFGVSGIVDDNMSKVNPGGTFRATYGGWITPVHGVRLALDAGIKSTHLGVDRVWMGSVGFDYMLNLSALTRGYDPSRRFEIIGAVGARYQRIRQGKHWGNLAGLDASLQFRYNVDPLIFIFLEPSMTVFTGTRYDGAHDWRRMRTDLALNIGFGYRLLSGEKRQFGSIPFRQINDDNLFFGIGGGIWDMMRNNFPSHMLRQRDIVGRVFVGKMFSSTSGLRLDIDGGQYRPNYETYELGFGSLDYLLDLNSVFGGYRPRELFRMQVNVGLSAAYVVGEGSHFYPGANLGLQALFRLSDNWGIFVEPRVYAFSGGFYDKLQMSRSPFFTLMAGLRYTVGNFSRISPVSYERYAGSRHWFITMGVGGARRLHNGFGNGGTLSVGFGKRFTPVSTWRVSVDGELYPRWPHYWGTTLAADYMLSLTTSTCGYDPRRVFDLHAMVGVFGGAANYQPPITATYGGRVGLHADFRLNSSLSLFVEPQLLAIHGPVHDKMVRWEPEARVMLGLNYRLGTPEGWRGHISQTPYGLRRNFAGLSAGPSLHGGTGLDGMKGMLDAHIGRWFSMVSGLRLSYVNDWIRHVNHTLYIGSAHLDYLLNVTSLMDRSAERKFHIIGAIGGGLAYCGNKYNMVGPAAYGGVQFRFNLPANIDFHIEPCITAIANRVLPFEQSPNRFFLTGAFKVGASYRF